MADDDTPEQRPDPFAGLPLFGDLSKALAGQGPLNWDAARQFAQVGATGGAPEANVEPAVRLAFDELAGIVRPHVADVVGSSHEPGEVRVVTRSQWASETLEAYRHLFTEMATALGSATVPDDEAAADPMLSMMAGLSRMMAPAMLGMSVGSMVGRLATRAFGTHDLPIPRQPELVTLVPSNIDAFAAQWEIPRRRDAALGARPRARRCARCSRPSTCGERCRTSCAATSAGSGPTPVPSPSG